MGKKYEVAFQTIQRWTGKQFKRIMDKKEECGLKEPTKLKLDTNEDNELLAEMRKKLLVNKGLKNGIKS